MVEVARMHEKLPSQFRGWKRVARLSSESETVVRKGKLSAAMNSRGEVSISHEDGQAIHIHPWSQTRFELPGKVSGGMSESETHDFLKAALKLNEFQRKLPPSARMAPHRKGDY